jgi:PIN domain nuclease of toxin-antitoxin system
MKRLLDTHIFLWFINRDTRLPNKMRDAIRDPTNQAYLSVVSFWEIVVKHQLGKLPLPQAPETYIPQQRQFHQIIDLSLHEDSIKRLVALPSAHRDPFDRMLVCQALEYNLTLMTVDPVLQQYPAAIFR